MKRYTPLLSLAVMVVLLVIPVVTFAQFPDFGTGYLGGADLPTGDLRDVIINFVNVLLSILGIIFLLLVLYGGFLWMTAGGNDDQAAKGRAVIRNGVIGLIVIFVSFAIVTLVFNILGNAA